MREGIHPKYTEIKATCSCGNVIMTRSTIGRDISIDVCSNCHPFYTGKQKIVDTAGRVDRFMQKYGKQAQEPANESAAKSAKIASEKPEKVEKVKAEKAVKAKSASNLPKKETKPKSTKAKKESKE